jgi:hypothetical protein
MNTPHILILLRKKLKKKNFIGQPNEGNAIEKTIGGGNQT